MIKSLSHFEAVVGYSVKEIEAILAKKQDYYYHFSKLKGIVKGKNVYRHFHPSKKALKDLQNRIQSRIFSDIELPKHIQGCVRGRGNITNAKFHQGKLYKFHTDLKSYFDFVTNAKVYEALIKLGFSQKVSHLITNITTYQGHLPQGPPTSPFLANIAGLDMDNEILELCRQNNITYTRFVDDLGFSSQSDFQQETFKILEIIKRHEFLPGHKKTVYKKGRLELTGSNIANNLLAPTKRQIEKYCTPETSDFTRKGLDAYFKGLRNKKL